MTGTGESQPRLVAYIVNPRDVPLNDLQARLRQQPRRGLADAARGPRDQRGLSLPTNFNRKI